MSAQERKMKPLDEEIARIDREIMRLQAERGAIERVKRLLTAPASGPPAVAAGVVETIGKKRATRIKPMIIDIMTEAGERGATSAEVAASVRNRAPEVSKDTVGSILSRLKSDGAFVYDGERYYDSRFATKTEKSSFETLRVVG